MVRQIWIATEGAEMTSRLLDDSLRLDMTEYLGDWRTSEAFSILL